MKAWKKQGRVSTYFLCLGILNLNYLFHCIDAKYYLLAAAAAKSLQLCLTLCNPRDGRLPGSSLSLGLNLSLLQIAIYMNNFYFMINKDQKFSLKKQTRRRYKQHVQERINILKLRIL